MTSAFVGVKKFKVAQLYVPSVNGESKKDYEVNVTNKNGITYIDIVSIEEKEIERVFQNLSRFSLILKNEENYLNKIDPMTEYFPFINRDPDNIKNHIRIELMDDEKRKTVKVLTLDITRITGKKYFKLEDGGYIYVEIKFKEKQKLIRFQEYQVMKKEKKRGFTGSTIVFKVPKISISFVDYINPFERRELVLVSLKDFRLKFSVDETTYNLNMNLNRIQADNNYDKKTDYPVILDNYEFSTKKNEKINDILKLRLSLERGGSTSFLYVKNLDVFMYGFKAFFEEEHMDFVMRMSKRMMKTFQILAEDDFDWSENIKQRYFLGKVDLLKEWERSNVNHSNYFITFDSVSLPSIAIEFSYFQDSSGYLRDRRNMISLIGAVTGGLDEARLQMRSLKMK